MIEEKHVFVDGRRMRYLTGGSGPNLVFVHGILGYSFSWRHNLEALAQQNAVFALDLPGRGHSEPAADLSGDLAAAAGQVLKFMRAVGLRSASLLGSSHGGSVAMMAAALAPQSGITVEKLILISPVNPFSRNGRLLLWLARTWLGTALLQRLAVQVTPLHNVFLRRMYGDPRRISPGTLEGYMQPLRRQGALDPLLQAVRSWKANIQQLTALLADLRELPMLLIWGGRDRAVDILSAYKLLEIFPGAELIVMKEAGHLPYEEFPEEFNQAVRRFLFPS